MLSSSVRVSDIVRYPFAIGVLRNCKSTTQKLKSIRVFSATVHTRRSAFSELGGKSQITTCHDTHPIIVSWICLYLYLASNDCFGKETVEAEQADRAIVIADLSMGMADYRLN